MTPTRQMLVVGSIVWAVGGAAVALSALPQANGDARWILGVASVAFPAAAAAAALALQRGAPRCAGLLLLLSVATPTYFAWPLNVPALIAGLALLVAPAPITDMGRPHRA